MVLGEWKNSKIGGYGKFILPEGHIYVGNF